VTAIRTAADEAPRRGGLEYADYLRDLVSVVDE